MTIIIQGREISLPFFKFISTEYTPDIFRFLTSSL